MALSVTRASNKKVGTMWTRSATSYRGGPWTTAAVLLCLALSSAATEEPFNRFYLGFAGGYSSGFRACNAFSSDFVPGKCGEDDIGWKFFGGFQFTRNWGIELAFT